MSKILAIDTTEAGCSTALLVGDQLYHRFELAPRRHSELILPMMESVLSEADLSLSDLDALAFARGPGAFTGIRISTAVIQGVAFGADLPVVPVSSLQALAQGVLRQHGENQVLVAFDARMNEVYFGAYTNDSGIMQLTGNEQVAAPGQVVVDGDGDWAAAGSGWQAYPDMMADHMLNPGPIYAEQQIDARDVASIASVTMSLGVSAEQALPVYLRNEVAWKKSR
ncbi:MAG: tRNA (adenosine(37)-N6)-threonylcarbamoyltransferase complex dimerization subunit type 1 TsaB [bacterium]